MWQQYIPQHTHYSLEFNPNSDFIKSFCLSELSDGNDIIIASEDTHSDENENHAFYYLPKVERESKICFNAEWSYRLSIQQVKGMVVDFCDTTNSLEIENGDHQKLEDANVTVTDIVGAQKCSSEYCADLGVTVIKMPTKGCANK